MLISVGFLPHIIVRYEILSPEGVEHIQDTRAARLMHNFGAICKIIHYNQNLVALLMSFIFMVFNDRFLIKYDLLNCRGVPFVKEVFTRRCANLCESDKESSSAPPQQ